jgi:hypothetical protein
MSALFAILCAVTATAQSSFTTDSETHDGMIAGMCIQPDASSNAAGKRAWIAQGRVRAAIRLSDNARMNAENQSFSCIKGQPELLTAVAVDDNAHYLYTLTDSALYREDIAGTCTSNPCQACTGSTCTPANPGNRVYFDYSNSLLPALHSGEVPIKMLPIPLPSGSTCTGSYVLVLTTLRLIVLQSTATGLNVLSQCLDLEQEIGGTHGYLHETPPNPTFDGLKIKKLTDVKIATDHVGDTIAYVFGEIGIYQFHGFVSHSIILLCNLDGQNCFSTPTLDVDSSSNVQFVYWNPFAAFPPVPVPPSQTTPTLANAQLHACYDFSIRTLSNQTDIFAACGSAKGVRWLNAKFVPGGITEYSQIPLPAGQNFLVSHSDPNAPGHLYVQGVTDLFDVDLAAFPPSYASLPDKQFFRKAGDSCTAIMPGGSPSGVRTIWMMSSNAPDYHVKAFDVSGLTPSLYVGLGYMDRSDGGVALDFDNTYVLTDGGIQHYHYNGHEWDQAGYRDTPSPYGNCFAEQLDLAHIASGDDRLIAPANTYDAPNNNGRCGLMDWHLDATTHEPLAGTYYDIPTSVFANWTPGTSTTVGDNMYVNDVAFMDWNNTKWAVLCPTRLPLGSGNNSDFAIVVFKWDPSSSAWLYVAHCEDPELTYSNNGFANTIALGDATSAPLGKLAFLATDSGVRSFDLSNIAASSPSISFRSATTDGPSFGLAVARGRLIVLYGVNAAAEYKIYDIDRSVTPGTVLLPSFYTVTPSALGLPSTLQTFRFRYDSLGSGTGYIYHCADNGSVYRLKYNASGYGSLTYNSLWTSLSTGVIQDCRVVTVGSAKKLMVTKDEEAFTWLNW